MRLILTISWSVIDLSFPNPDSEILQKGGFHAMEALKPTTNWSGTDGELIFKLKRKYIEYNQVLASDFWHPYYRASFM